MYGVLVGKAQYDIPQGGWMNTDNTKHAAEPYVYRKQVLNGPLPMCQNLRAVHLTGITAAMEGWVLANYWLFVPTVFAKTEYGCDPWSHAQWTGLCGYW